MRRIKNIGFVIIGVGAMLAVLFFAKSLFIQKNALPMTAGIQNPQKAAMGREDITITFASTMAEDSFYQGIVAAFEEQHPNIHVQVLPYSGEADPAELASQADTILLGSAVFVLMPLVALKNGDILRDALFLAMKEPKTDLLLIVVVGGWLTAVVLLLPYSIPFVAVFGLSLVSLATCTILYGPVKKHILDKANEIS